MHIEFLTDLDKNQVYISQLMTHELWGDGAALHDRYEKLLGQLQFSDGGYLKMQGLADEAGKLLSSLKTYSVLLRFGGCDLKTIGLGAVFTPPANRGQGLAAMMLRRVLADAQALGYAAALLYSDIDPRYYEQFGFMKLPAEDTHLTIADLPDARPSLKLVKATDADTPKLLRWYENTHAAKHGPIRTRDLWTFFRQRNGKSVDYLVVDEDTPGVSELGYINVEEEAEHLLVNDFCIQESLEGSVLGLLKGLARSAGKPELRAWQGTLPLTSFTPKRKVRTKAIPMLASLQPDVDFHDADLKQFYFSALDHF